MERLNGLQNRGTLSSDDIRHPLQLFRQDHGIPSMNVMLTERVWKPGCILMTVIQVKGLRAFTDQGNNSSSVQRVTSPDTPCPPT